MRHPAGQKLYSYWEALRRDRVAPERDEIDPGAVRAVLADTFVLEYAPEERFPMRIAGGRTEALFLRQLRGASFLSLWRRDDASQVADILGYVADESAPFIVGARSGPGGFPRVDCEVLLLPLLHHGDLRSRILGLCAPLSVPDWLGLIGIEPFELTSFRALGVGGVDLSSADAVQENAAHVYRRGHLFVHENTKS